MNINMLVCAIKRKYRVLSRKYVQSRINMETNVMKDIIGIKHPKLLRKNIEEVNDLVKKKIKLDELNLGIEQKINNNEAVVNSLHQIKTQLSNDITELNVENNKLNVELERLKLLVTPTERGKLYRERIIRNTYRTW